MVSWLQRVSRRLGDWADAETVLGGMTVAWVTAAILVAMLTLVLRREISRRQRVLSSFPTAVHPAPRPKIVLRLPRREM